jgi:hypothetical protein
MKHRIVGMGDEMPTIYLKHHIYLRPLTTVPQDKMTRLNHFLLLKPTVVATALQEMTEIILAQEATISQPIELVMVVDKCESKPNELIEEHVLQKPS